MEVTIVTGKERGFTLIELIIVITIIGILAAISIPAMRQAPIRAKEAALKENLFTLRNVIDQYYADHGQYPQSLEDLVSEGYLRRIPVDPMTGEAEWGEVYYEAEEEEGFGEGGGIWDVYSLSQGVGLDGTPYSEW